MIEVVFFDVGGVIYDDGRYRTALLEALRELRPGVDETRFAAVYEECRRTQRGSFRRAIAGALLDGEADAKRLGDAAKRRWTLPADALLPDAEAALRALHGRYRLGVIANQRTLARAALERDGLADLFEVWALSEDVGVEKPDPRIFAEGLRQAGVPPERAVHVGNRLDTDVRGARAAGIHPIWIPRGEGPDDPPAEQRAEAAVVIATLGELPDAVAGLS